MIGEQNPVDQPAADGEEGRSSHDGREREPGLGAALAENIGLRRIGPEVAPNGYDLSLQIGPGGAPHPAELASPVPEMPAADEETPSGGEEWERPAESEGAAESGPDGEPIPAAEAGPAAPPRETRRGGLNVRGLVVEILQTVLLTLIIFAGVRSIVQNFKVDGASMEPTLHSGQYLLINKMAYFHVEGPALNAVQRVGLVSPGASTVFPFGGPQRGDVIVFRYPGRPDRDFIKRVIALPGDTVQIEHGRVYVNDVLLQEEYIRAVPTYSLARERVPEGNYFVLGDNRPNSSDSHIWGYVPEDNLIGRAWLSYWPPDLWGVVANSGLAGN